MYSKCIKPVRSPKKESHCLCGREIGVWGDHAIKIKKHTGKKLDMFDQVKKVVGVEVWEGEANCKRESTTSFGLVTMREPEEASSGDINEMHLATAKPYVRVTMTDCVENPKYLRDLLVKKWDLEPPRIMMVITGGAQSFDLPPKLDEMITTGLAKAAEAEGLWITTGGTNTGVMKYVSECIAKSVSALALQCVWTRHLARCES